MGVPEAVEKIIRESGNNFHAKVARWLVDNGWLIRVSPYYMDQEQSKAREIDLVAEKASTIPNRFGPASEELVVRLFVECKFIPAPAVFWMGDKDMLAAERLVCRQGGGFRPHNSYTARHHYLSQGKRVAKLFATARTPEQDPFYKALNQVLNAQASMLWQPPAVLSDCANRSGALMNYPVIVCSSFSEVYAADFTGDEEPHSMGSNFQLEVQYAYTDRKGNSQDDYFLIDVVDFNQLSEFSEALESDAKAARSLLSPKVYPSG